MAITTALGTDHDKDIERKREKRSKAAAVIIPPVADPDRREACLADPERFLRVYGARVFFNPFAVHHQRMIAAIYERARSGGDKSVAAPRGDGKTQIATYMLVFILLACLVRFPLVVAATRKHAQKIFKQFKRILATGDLAADFPEISACVRALHGAPQRAAKQHVVGEPTQIIWTQDEIGLPHVPGSPYGGRFLAYFGLDSAIRGVHIDACRPDFALIDDPETREVAFSQEQHWNIEDMIDGDIAGLAGPNTRMARVVLTTCQNRKCYSWRVTDPQTKPTFDGERYGVLSSRPAREDLWEEYVVMRQQSQAQGDKDGGAATEFYLANRDEMERGAVVSNPYRFTQAARTDGEAQEVSALQAYYNRVADWGWPRVRAELDNDPEEEETPETIGLTPGKVMLRVNGLIQNELPREDVLITVGCDVGKYRCHWVKIAWWGRATGAVIDYGVIEVDDAAGDDQPAIERMILRALTEWRPHVMGVNPPVLGLVDSNAYTSAVKAFCALDGVFFPSKGYAERMYREPKPGRNRVVYEKCWAGKETGTYLFHVEVDHWKVWVHERFNTPTFNDAHQFNDGTLSLYVDPDPKHHNAIAHHICAEELRFEFTEGKGVQRKWHVHRQNNHYLDATALACCAAGAKGMRLIPQPSTQLPDPVRRKTTPKPAGPNRFIQRPGGWVPRR